MEANKRSIDGDDSMALVAKKQKTGELAISSNSSSALTTASHPALQRTSGLQGPIMLLTGHRAEIFSVQFSPSGKYIASGSFDKTILLWNTYGECENYCMLRGHQNAVLDLHWNSEETHIISSSADKTVQIWDVQTGVRAKKYSGHVAAVNSVCPVRKGYEIVSGSDDGCIKVWDTRTKTAELNLKSPYAVTSICFSEAGDQIISGGLDNDIKVWDRRKLKDVLYKLEGHTDTVTGLSLSHDGSYLLSNAMDNHVYIWDVRPFVQGSRLLKDFQGVQHNFEKTLLRCAWSPDGSKISAGSADRFVYIWDTESRRILYKLPGHRGAVNAVDFHPKEPIVVSASSDQSIFLGEIKA